MTTPFGSPRPERILATLIAYQTSTALAAAIRFDLFTYVASGTDTLPALARATGVSERGLRALANHLVAHGFLQKSGERYRCSDDAAAFLDRRNPLYMGAVTGFLNDPGFVSCFDDLDEAVRRGGTSAPAGGAIAAENPMWVRFARAMQPAARGWAPGVADAVCRAGVPERVLDVAAGHGFFGIELGRRSLTTELVFQDWANVLAVTREHVERAGLASRARYLPGNAFEVDFGSGFDAVLVTNFLHHFSRPQCVGFLEKCRAALTPRGRVAVLEFALEEDRLTPAPAAAFDLVMLATTPEGEAYTAGEYGRMFADAGLAKPERSDLRDGSHAVLVAGAAP